MALWRPLSRPSTEQLFLCRQTYLSCTIKLPVDYTFSRNKQGILTATPHMHSPGSISAVYIFLMLLLFSLYLKFVCMADIQALFTKELYMGSSALNKRCVALCGGRTIPVWLGIGLNSKNDIVQLILIQI